MAGKWARAGIILGIIFAVLVMAAPAMATNAKQIDFLLSGTKNATGSVLSGGLVYTYSAGTTTAKTCWTDATKDTEAANPFVLDSYGKGTLYCDGNYKFVIKTSAGVTVDTLNNMYYAVPGADLSATLIVSASTSITSTYNSYYCTAAGGAVTLDLPDCTSNTGLRLKVVKTDSSANACTLDGYGAQTINGSATAALSSQYAAKEIECDGTSWYVLAQSTLADAATLDTYDTALANAAGTSTLIIPLFNTSTELSSTYEVGLANTIDDQGGGSNIQVRAYSGTWNMDTSASLQVAHGLAVANVVGVIGTVFNNAGTSKYTIGQTGDTTNDTLTFGTVPGGSGAFYTGSIWAYRLAGSLFDNANFNAAPYKVLVIYTE